MPKQNDATLESFFVNREQEIAEILSKLNDVPEEGRSCAINLLGERGSGKTWLLRHFHQNHPPQNSFISYYLDFSGKHSGGMTAPGQDSCVVIPNNSPLNASLDKENNEFAYQEAENPETALLHLVKALTHTMNVFYFEDSTLADMKSRLQRGIEKKIKEKTLIIFLFDDLYNKPGDLLDLIEEYLLIPLLELPVAVVLSGRGHPYDWISPQLRLEAETISLPPFRKDTTEEQIRNYWKDRGFKEEDFKTVADEIYKLSAGYPYANAFLAREWERYEKDPETVLSNLIDCLFGFINDKEHREKIISYVEALSVLNPWEVNEEQADRHPHTAWGFRSNAVRPFLNHYRECSSSPALEEEVDQAKVFNVFQELIDLRIVQWEYSIGYYIDEALRFPIVARLKKKTELWICLHKRAKTYYENREKLRAEKHQEEIEQFQKASNAIRT